MSLARLLYPILFAIFLPLAIFAQRPTYILLGDAAAVCLTSAVTVAAMMAVVYGIVRVWLRPGPAASVAAAAAFGAVGLFYGYRALGVAGRLMVARPTPVLVVGCALVGVCAWAYHRRALSRLFSHRLDIERYLTVVAAVLVAWSAVQVTVHEVAGARALARSALVRELARPVPLRARGAVPAGDSAAGGARRKRDVYVLVLDEYASSNVLRERFGFDNHPFEDSLRALGFRIPASVRSNYAITLLSVPSLLNFAQMRPLAEEMPAGSRISTPLNYLIEHNRAAAFLKGQGYRYVFFPSAWFPATRASAEADAQYDPYRGFDLARSIYRSQFQTKVASVTMLSAFRNVLPSAATVYAEHAARTFAGVTAMAGAARPTFVFAHVLMPHAPWFEDAACRPVIARDLMSQGWDRSLASHAMLRDQVQCVNEQTLKTVRALIARSQPSPIIIIQGDHGTEESLNPPLSDTAVPDVEQARERFRAFGAYFLPGGGAAAIPESTSVVNVLRYVFSYYFGADLPPLPNTMFYSYQLPYAMTELDDDFRVARPKHVHPIVARRPSSAAAAVAASH
ncbi:MAG TPA: hypothetical protein VF461_16700 [Gemmatimonadaceae bacterium]